MPAKMSFMPLTVLQAAAWRANPQLLAVNRRVPMKVIAFGNIVKPVTPEQRAEIMPKEVPATLKHYLDGKIEQFFYRQDKPGVIFLMNVDSVEQAKATVEALPLTKEGYAQYDLIPVGPLAPLGLLIQGK
jgi:hypothetical protein